MADPENDLVALETRSARRPRVWTVFTAIALAIVLVLLSGVLVVGVAAAFISTDPSDLGATEAAVLVASSDPVIVGAAALLTGLLVGLLALTAAAAGRQRIIERLRLNRPPSAVLWATLGTLGIGSALHSATRLAGFDDGSTIEAFTLASRASWTSFLLILFGSTLVGAVAEELLFRGYVQTRLVERWGRWPGIGIAAFAFGLVHLYPTHMILAGAIGVWLGWAAVRTGSTWTAIIAHAVNNAVATIWARYLDVDGTWMHAGVGLVSLIFAVLAVRAFLRLPASPLATAPAASPEPAVPPAAAA